MNLQVEELRDEDVDECVQVYWNAFTIPEADMIMPMIWPLGLTPALFERLRGRFTYDPNSGASKRSFYVVKDPETRQIMAIAWWGDALNPPTDPEATQAEFEKIKRNRMGVLDIEGTNAELSNAFFHASFFSELEVAKDRPHITLKVLAADPLFGRKGAGRLLLAHGLQEADERNLPVYLDASWMGKPLYEQYGFEVVKPLPFDAREYGGRSPGLHWCMWRPAKSERQ